MLTRRHFGLGATALLAGAALPAFAQQARTVTTVLGTYDIPLDPRRVVAVDARTDYEAAMVLGLPVIAVGAHDFWNGRDFVPRLQGMADLAMPTTAEAVLALEPVLIICPGDEPQGEWWPAQRLLSVAPVLTTSFTRNWQDDLRVLAAWLDRLPAAEAAIARYDAAVSGLRERHKPVLAARKIAVLTYFAEDRSFAAFVPGGADDADPKEQLLADLGVATLDPAQLADGGFSMENSLDMLADVDAIWLCNTAMGAPADLEKEPLWSRIPAVAEGRVYVSGTYLWYGSYFTAMRAVEEMGATLDLLAV